MPALADGHMLKSRVSSTGRLYTLLYSHRNCGKPHLPKGDEDTGD